MNRLHLSDDRLIEMCFALDSTEPDRAHLLACTACESRRARLADTLGEVGDALAFEANEVFSTDRLARQRARILQRLDPDARPARVIAFPAGHAHAGVIPARRSRRWATVAAAVAASFVVGILAEHLAHDLPGRRQSVAVARQSNPPAAPSRAALSDDELLGQVELAAGRVGPAMLGPLDAVTPRAWDLR
jgi:hypothetical protein